jgi:demethylmenaquinone methyltransferase/2-methoxy-6-polyprenyl-1,4-benzoquinol methylase
LSLKGDLWRSVIQAIESAIPEYDFVNERVSLGRAQKTRNYAASHLKLENGILVLDAGIGPGTMSHTVLTENKGLTVVGLDASTVLLRAARERLRLYDDRVHFVRGAFEALPFRDDCFHRIVSAYAFRDARSRAGAIGEFYRASAVNGIFAIVDLGKPENRLKRALISIHVRYLVSLISRLSKSRAIYGNPWSVIFPTYQALGSNRELVTHLNTCFNNVEINEFALGGLIVIFATKGHVTGHQLALPRDSGEQSQQKISRKSEGPI